MGNAEMMGKYSTLPKDPLTIYVHMKKRTICYAKILDSRIHPLPCQGHAKLHLKKNLGNLMQCISRLILFW